ncbi:MAG TPA: mechanosensitive ion channel [Marine Group III euryarchaeote]|nr:mechanosensitive ion channel [Marine Group III euryarchaeote]
MLGFVLSIVSILFLRPYIADFVPSPYYSITVEGEDFIIFTELSIWTLILMAFVTFLTVFFIIPLTLYFRGLSEWEWDPTVVVFWMIMTRGSSLFFSEIADTNTNLEAYTLILIDIVDSIFVLFMTVFLLRAYSNYFVPIISDWLTVGKTDTQYGPLLEIIGSLLIIVFGVTNFLSTYHVDFGVLLAGVGVVGLVIALAAQDTLSNFFSGILLLLDQGFKTGDMIYFNDTYCLIRDIGLRSTKIYDIVNHVMIITPNNSLANQNILNLTRPDRYYRIRIEVGVSYDSDPDQVEKLLLEVAEQNSDVEQDDPTRMPLVRFQDFGDSSLTFVLVAWINNVIKIRQINSDLHHQVFDKLKDAGVTIAFPQRDVHIHGVPEPAITKSPRPASTKSPKPATAKSPKAAKKKK